MLIKVLRSSDEDFLKDKIKVNKIMFALMF